MGCNMTLDQYFEPMDLNDQEPTTPVDCQVAMFRSAMKCKDLEQVNGIQASCIANRFHRRLT